MPIPALSPTTDSTLDLDMEHQVVDAENMVIISAHMEVELSKGTPATPKKMFKSLKRVYTASIACLETHIQITGYQSTVHKKLALKTTSKDDLGELRRICEDLTYIIQVPHDRGIYTTALRLLSSVATSPDSMAFILLEGHINPVLRHVLETSTELPSQKSAALLLVLDHLRIRQQISLARHAIVHVVAKAQPDIADLISIEAECRRLIVLAEENPAEIWINLMVQDLLASVAKHPSLSPTLLQRDVYLRLVKITARARKILLFDRLSKPLAKLVVQNSPAVVEMRRVLLPLLVKPFITSEDSMLCREICSRLIELISSSQEREKTSSIQLLELIARSSSPLSWVLTESDFYETIEKTWALGTTSVDDLYRLVQDSLADRLTGAEAAITSITSSGNISDGRADQLVHIFQDLIDICKAHQVYDEDIVDRAANLLLGAVSASEAVSYLLLDSTLLDQYPQILDGTPHSSKAKKFVNSIPELHARKKLRDAEMLVSRLKHTRTWSGLDSDNVRPLCQTLVASALNPNLRALQDVAVNALVELTKSPSDCATVLLEPEIATGIRAITSQCEGSGPADQLANAMSSLQLQGQLRADIPRLYRLSNKRSFDSRQEMMEFQVTICHLVQLYTAYEGDESMSQLIITSLLVVATGFQVSQELLEQAQGTALITRHYLHRAGFEPALHEVMQQMELSADRLLRQSQLGEKDQGRFRIIFHRLIQLSRLNLDDWSTSRAVELLGALAKGSETAAAGLLTISDFLEDLHTVAQNKRLTEPIGRILSILGVKEAPLAL